jgi:NADH-ubiquinone oxidoreductase chain 6
MSNLHIFNEIFTNGLSYNLLNIISITSILCGILVIITKNPIVSVLFLIGLFISIAGYLMMLGVNFIGLSYLLVYVGAVSILFLFILMLINVRVSELVSDNSNSIPLAIMIGIFFNIALNKLLPSNINTSMNVFSINNIFINPSSYYSATYGPRLLQGRGPGSNSSDSVLSNWRLMEKIQSIDLFFVTSHVWDGTLAESSHITSIGNIIYTSYPVWLILTSIILLLAMVGAIVITIKK